MSGGAIPLTPRTPAAVTAAEDEALAIEKSALRASLSTLIGSATGKIGLIMFIVMIGISVYVLTTYPRDFGDNRWSSPIVWANNPKVAGPEWTRLWNRDAARQQSFSIAEPAQITTRGPAEVRDFPVTIHQRDGEGPQFLSTTLTGITFNGRAPLVVISLLRPDGGDIRLVSLAVPAPRAGETAPYGRFYDTPERILLSQQDTAAKSIATFFSTEYPDAIAPTNLNDNLNAALFGVPASDGSGHIEILPGDYTLNVKVLVADPKDVVAPIESTYAGTVYGIMGTDNLGRDLSEGLLYGFPVALLIAAVVSVLSTIIGGSLGILSGFAGGLTDSVIQRSCDIISNVPTLPLLIFLVFIFGSHLWLILLLLVAFGWTGLTIIVRSMVLQLRSGQLVEAAQAVGASRTRIMARHIFPQVAPFIVAQMIFFAPGAILAEASLSFLGLGDPSIPTWGQMLQAGFNTGALYVGYWWWVIPPGVLIVVTALAFMLLALALEAVVDPRLRNPS